MTTYSNTSVEKKMLMESVLTFMYCYCLLLPLSCEINFVYHYFGSGLVWFFFYVACCHFCVLLQEWISEMRKMEIRCPKIFWDFSFFLLHSKRNFLFIQTYNRLTNQLPFINHIHSTRAIIYKGLWLTVRDIKKNPIGVHQ